VIQWTTTVSQKRITYQNECVGDNKVTKGDGVEYKSSCQWGRPWQFSGGDYDILAHPQPNKIKDAFTPQATPTNAKVHIPEERLWQHSGSEDLS